MLPAVGDTDTRPDFSPAERNKPDRSLSFLAGHNAPPKGKIKLRASINSKRARRASVIAFGPSVWRYLRSATFLSRGFGSLTSRPRSRAFSSSNDRASSENRHPEVAIHREDLVRYAADIRYPMANPPIRTCPCRLFREQSHLSWGANLSPKLGTHPKCERLRKISPPLQPRTTAAKKFAALPESGYGT